MQRISMSACPACQQVNANQATLCRACGSPLVARCPACDTINARSRERCHHCGAPLSPAQESDTVPAVLTVTVPPKGERVETERMQSAEEPDETSPAATGAAAPFDSDPSGPGPLLTLRLDELLELDSVALLKPARKSVPPDFPPIVFDEIRLPNVPPPVLTPAEKKAARRASVRRAQQRNQRRTLADPGVRPEVLVLEPNAEIRAELADVLKLFGFTPQPVASVSEADQLAHDSRFVATFIGLAPQDLLACGLCTRLRSAPRPSMRPLAVVGMVDKGRHADRVRMELAGADEVLFRPVDRGDVARALENCGLRLPHDPRALTKP